MLQLPGTVSGQELPKAKGYNGALLYLTRPSSKTAVFDEDDDVFYVIETDVNNNKVAVDRFRFYPEPIEDVNDKKYASKEDFNTLKEMILNVQQSVQQLSEAAVSNNASNSNNKSNKQHNPNNRTN